MIDDFAAPMTLGEQGAALVPDAAGPFSILPSAIDANDEIAVGVAWARRLASQDRAQSTLDKYARDWALYVHWLGANRPALDPAPTPGAALGAYIGFLRSKGLTKGTILGRVAAVTYAHDLMGAPSPIAHQTLRKELRGLRREVETDRQDRSAIEREMATAMAAALLAKIRAAGDDATLYDLRDLAIFTVGWLSALRRSNIAALRRRDIAIRRDDLTQSRYLEIQVRRSKTDQTGKGRPIGIGELPAHEPLCAVRAVHQWLAATASLDSDAPLFPSFAGRASGGHLTDRPVGGRDIVYAVKRIIREAKLPGVDADDFAAHGMRRGFATSAISKGVNKALVREHGGWKSDAMLNRYTVVDEQRNNAVRELFR